MLFPAPARTGGCVAGDGGGGGGEGPKGPGGVPVRAPVVVVDVVVDEVDRVVVVVGTRKTQSDGSGPRQPAEARQRLLQFCVSGHVSESYEAS